MALLYAGRIGILDPAGVATAASAGKGIRRGGETAEPGEGATTCGSPGRGPATLAAHHGAIYTPGTGHVDRRRVGPGYINPRDPSEPEGLST